MQKLVSANDHLRLTNYCIWLIIHFMYACCSKKKK